MKQRKTIYRRHFIKTSFITFLLISSAIFGIYLINPSFSSSTTMYVDPASKVDPGLTPGSTFTVKVMVSDVEDLSNWQVMMMFDSSVVKALAITKGDFLAGQPEGTLWSSKIGAVYCMFGESTKGNNETTGEPYPGVSGSGWLGSVEFEVQGMGATVLNITNPPYTYLQKWSDTPPYELVDMDFEMENGYFSNTAVAHTLAVDSDPITGVGFTVNGTAHTTPWSDSLPEGTYIIVMPSTWDTYDFDRWEDGSTDPTRTISLTSDKTVTAYYEYVPETHTLAVDSDPITGVGFTVNGTAHTTPWSDSLPEGTYIIVMPSTWDTYDFDRWEDTSTNPTRTVSLTADKTVTAYYVKRQWTLNVTSDPFTGVGFTLDGLPHTTPWSSLLDEEDYTIVMPSTWTAGLDVYNFDHWEDNSTNPTRTVSLTENMTITAYYVVAQERYELVIGVNGNGTTFPDPGKYIYNAGTNVLVAAIPDPDCMLHHWELDEYNVGSDETYTVPMNANHTLIAFFVEITEQYQLTIEVVGSGSTDPSPGPHLYAAGTNVTVDAIPAGGWMLDHWELDGDDVGSEDPYTVTMDANHTLKAIFLAMRYELTVDSDPLDGVNFTLDGLPQATPWSSLLDEGNYTIIMPPTWTAGLDVYNFNRWEDNSTNPTRVVSLTENMTVTAYYVLAPKYWTLAVESDPFDGVEFTLDDVTHTTPYSDSLIEGSHTVVMPPTWTVGPDIYNFDQWEDASTDRTRTVDLTSNMTVTAYYTLAPVAETVVAVDPPINTANPGEYFTINITIANVADLYVWAFKLRWPTGLLACSEGDIIEGPFLKQAGDTTFTKKTFTSYIDVGCMLLTATQGVNGDGTLATVTLKVLKPGNCTLDLYDITLLDSNYAAIDFTPRDGTFYTTYPVASYMYSPHPQDEYGRPIVGETVTFNATTSYDPDQSYRGQTGIGIDLYEWDFNNDGTYDYSSADPYATHIYDAAGNYRVILRVTDDDGENSTADQPIIVKLHDIAVIDVTVASTLVSVGEMVAVNVTVLNEGSDTETLNVTLYANMQLVQTKLFDYFVPPSTVPYHSLPSGKNETTTLTWDTTGFPPGNYTISVEVYLVHMVAGKWVSAPGIEQDLSDNEMVYGDITLIEEVHDIAITNVVPSPTAVTVGETVAVNVTVMNEGHYNETFDVYAYADLDTAVIGDEIVIGTMSGVSLDPGASTTLEFAWDTTGRAEGSYTISAEASEVPEETDTDDNLYIDDTVNVTLLKEPPVAAFTYSPAVPTTGEIVTFNASGSYDPDGTIVSYAWDFGDGSSDTGEIVTNVYDDGGTYTVTLTVTDNDGLTDTTTKEIMVLNRPPTAVFTESAETVLTLETIMFNASGSHDPDGTIASYFWDFGDGTSATGMLVEHSYTDDGTYTVTLTVTDDDGATDSATADKTVLNQAPTAIFTESAEEVYVNETIHFDASDSNDPDGSVVSYWWDFGDGTNASGVVVEHAYAEDGSYTVTLTVTDNDDATDTATAVKTVLPPGLEPPVASFTYSPAEPWVNETVTFDASTSYDPDGTIVSYEWDFGDGTTATGMITTHTYTEVGTYTVTLTVTDNDGLTDTTTAYVTVSPPTRLYVYPPTSIKTPNSSFTVDIKVADVPANHPLYSWQVFMSFNSSVLECVNITEGDFLIDQPEGTIGFSNIKEDWAMFGWSTKGKHTGVPGSGTLATVEFLALGMGESVLNITSDLTYLLEFRPPPVPPGEEPLREIRFVKENGYVAIAQAVDHPVEVGGVTFHVTTQSNSTVSDFSFNQTQKQVSFNVTGPEGTVGFCYVTIPKDLLSDPFTVLINGQPLPYEMTENATHYFLYFTYNHTTHMIEIIGGTVATPPIAAFTYSPSEPDVGETVNFDASASYDPDGTIVSYGWDFGDGMTGTGVTTAHTYTSAGTFTVTLTIMDDDGLTDRATEGVTVREIAVLTAAVNIEPDTLNLKSNGKWVSCYITLPEGYDVRDIDVSTIMLEDSIPAERGETSGDTLMVKFNRADVIHYIRHVLGVTDGEVTLTITGSLTQSISFKGEETIRIISRGGGRLSR